MMRAAGVWLSIAAASIPTMVAAQVGSLEAAAADLDLTTAAGRTQLDARLAGAIERTCRPRSAQPVTRFEPLPGGKMPVIARRDPSPRATCVSGMARDTHLLRDRLIERSIDDRHRSDGR